MDFEKFKEDERNVFVDITPYLIPATEKILNEIELKIGQEVRIRKIYDPLESWQVRSMVPYHIDMPYDQEDDQVSFTHELLHIYFDYVQGMKVTDGQIFNYLRPYLDYYDDPWTMGNNFVSMINNLQHHKMIPYFKEFKLPIERIVLNYENPINLFKSIDILIDNTIDTNKEVVKYHFALTFANYLIMERYFPNPTVRTMLKSDYATKVDLLMPGLRELLIPIIQKWDTDYNNLGELLSEINSQAKLYAVGDSGN